MRLSPYTIEQTNTADLLAELDRQRWLVRSGKRAYGRSDRRVGRGGVHNAVRPSDRTRGRRRADLDSAGAASSSLGVLALVGLFLAASWLAFFGLIWLAVQVVGWAIGLLGGGKT